MNKRRTIRGKNENITIENQGDDVLFWLWKSTHSDEEPIHIGKTVVPKNHLLQVFKELEIV